MKFLVKVIAFMWIVVLIMTVVRYAYLHNLFGDSNNAIFNDNSSEDTLLDKYGKQFVFTDRYSKKAITYRCKESTLLENVDIRAQKAHEYMERRLYEVTKSSIAKMRREGRNPKDTTMDIIMQIAEVQNEVYQKFNCVITDSQ